MNYGRYIFTLKSKFGNDAQMKKTKFQTGRVTLVAFSHFIHDVYTSFLSPLLPLIIEKLSLTLSQAGLLSTVMQLPALLNPVIGLFADNKGLARWLVVLAPTLTAIPMSLVLHTSSYYVLLILVFILIYPKIFNLKLCVFAFLVLAGLTPYWSALQQKYFPPLF